MIIKFISLLLILISFTAYSSDYIPNKAFKYKDIIKLELDIYFPTIPNYNYIPALAEHESCITLIHKKCWEPSSELLTYREQGLGLFQTTRAFRKDKSIRFDTLQEMKDNYVKELKEANWNTFKYRPDLQIRMAILMIRDTYKKLYSVESPIERLYMTDAAYNGGLNGLLKERRACGLSSKCNPNIWFNNVELYCLKSKKILYGNRTPCDINRDHVKLVFLKTLPKYNKYYFKENINVN